MNVSLVGATGYSGAELIRLLHGHPVFRLSAIYTHSKGGESIRSYFPHLAGLCELIMADIDPEAIKAKSDLVFLAVPAGISRDWSKKLRAVGLKVVDLSGDFRLEDLEEYKEWYKKEPIAAEELAGVVYGLADVAPEAVKTAEFISNPGCYATASLLGLYPLARAGLILPDSVIIDAKSGVSGAGRGASVGTLYCEVALDAGTLHALYTRTYADAPFIRVRPLGEFPATKEVQGTNFCDIGVAVNERTGRVIIVSVLDNLVKGAAGQAIQNANLWTGQDPMAGLDLVPMYP